MDMTVVLLEGLDLKFPSESLLFLEIYRFTVKVIELRLFAKNMVCSMFRSVNFRFMIMGERLLRANIYDFNTCFILWNQLYKI